MVMVVVIVISQLQQQRLPWTFASSIYLDEVVLAGRDDHMLRALHSLHMEPTKWELGTGASGWAFLASRPCRLCGARCREDTALLQSVCTGRQGGQKSVMLGSPGRPSRIPGPQTAPPPHGFPQTGLRHPSCASRCPSEGVGRVRGQGHARGAWRNWVALPSASEPKDAAAESNGHVPSPPAKQFSGIERQQELSQTLERGVGLVESLGLHIEASAFGTLLPFRLRLQ